MTTIHDIPVIETDVLVIGGGTAGPMAAVTVKEQDPTLKVLLLEKANVKRSGAISMGMDGLNNAVVPGHATPEQYVKEITIANDGVVHQPALMAYATRSFPMIEKLDAWGVHFQKDETGDYDMKKVHHLGTYVLPMPEGHNVKKILYRRLRRMRVEIENRFVATRLLKDASGRIAGMIGVNTRTAEPIIIRAKAVIMATGAAGRIGCRTPATCSAPTKTRPTAATAMPWPITSAPTWRTSSASRSTRCSRITTARLAPTSPARSAASLPMPMASASSSATTGPGR